jgi:hypothetical protein
MEKQLVFTITAAVLLAAIGSVALYTVHIADAQSNMTSAGGAKNMTTGSNMTGAGNATGGSEIHTTKPAGSGCGTFGNLDCNNCGNQC